MSQIATPTTARNNNSNRAHSHRFHECHPLVVLAVFGVDRNADGAGVEEEISEYGATGAGDDIMMMLCDDQRR